MKFSFFDYLAHNKPKQSVLLLENEGYPVQKLNNEFQLAKALQHVEMKVGEPFSRKLAEAHPDFHIMESYFKEIHSKELDKVKSEGERKLKAEGESVPQPMIQPAIFPTLKNNDLLIGMSLGFGVTAVILTAINLSKPK